MREISPAVNMSADDYLATRPKKVREITEAIRKEKEEGNRPVPSSSLIDKSNLLTPIKRTTILDQVALLVDENLTGRSDMCQQFSLLLKKALEYFELESRCCTGIAIYFDDDRREVYRWPHIWVRIGNEVVDGNTDILYENLMIPKEVKVNPYWGPVNRIPVDRRLRENRGDVSADTDVENIWWPDLKNFLEKKFPKNV